ncbi:MAG: YhdP family protein [Cognaticolwellia sp.]
MSVSAELNRWLKRLYKLLAILLVVFAVLISTLRLFLPYAHNYRQNVEDYLNTRFNSSMAIGELSMGWGKSGPTLVANNLELLSKNNRKISVDGLTVEVNFWRSLRTGQLVTKDFVISGAKLHFYPAALVNSSQAPATNDANQETLTESLSTILLEQISRFSIRDSHVLIHTESGERAFTVNDLSWLNTEERHRATGTVIIDGLSSNNFKLLLDFKGQSFDNLSGQAYLEANDVDITPWLGRMLAIEDANTHSAINFNAWLNISAGEAESIQLALGNNKISWQHLDNTQSFEVMGGDIKITTEHDFDYQLTSTPLTIKRNGLKTNKLSLLANVDGKNIDGYISGIELASFTGVSPLLFDNTELEALLGDLNAVGRIQDIHVRKHAEELAISALFNDVNSNFSHGIPGLEHLSGELLYSNNQLKVLVNAVDGALDFDQHFKQPIPYTKLSGEINAKFGDDGWQLAVNNLAFSSDNLNVIADLQVNSVNEQAVTMSLLASASDGNAKNAELFYPHLLMGDDLVAYLNGAIVDGTIEQALVLFNGPLQSFPFANNEGIFVVDAELSNSRFVFDPEWPAMENFAANLNFTNDSMLITGRTGTLSDIDVTGVEAAIAELSGAQVLTVDADFSQVQPQHVGQLMNASPMQDSIGATLEQVVVSGTINGDFSLTLPLNDPDAVIAQGHVGFKNNAIGLQTPGMDFAQVNGRLDYHNDVLSANGVTLNWRGLPLTLNVAAKQKAEFYNVNIETLAQWQEKHWQQQLPAELVKYGHGTLAWQGLLALNISDEDFSYDYQIDSTLDELELSLPAPFHKVSKEKRLSSIHAFGDKTNSTIKAEIGDNIDFHGLLEHQQTRFNLTHLVLGEAQLWLPTTGFHITADLAQADYQQWQPLVLDILAAVDSDETLASSSSNSEKEREKTDTSGTSVLSAPDKIHGQIKNLAVYGEDFQQVDFAITPEANWWLLNINAKELRGSAKFYPDWHQQGIAINADFMHLNKADSDLAIAELSEQLDKKTSLSHADATNAEVAQSIQQAQNSTALTAESQNATPVPAYIDQASNSEIFANVPPLTFACASCKYGRYNFGEVAFTVERENENTLLVNKFSAQRDKTKLAFDAKWQQNVDGSNTSIVGTLATNNVAAEVEDLGFVSIIKDSGIKMDYDVSWQGGPHDFATKTFDGKLQANFDDGYLADVDDSGVRILSLLSLQSLVRKLSFDFRDIFSDGMFYSELQGGFTVKDGIAYTDNVLMKGAAGDLTIVGNTNLNNGDLDYRMSYKPNLTSSLPVLAWIATLNPVTFLAGVALDEVITSSVIAEIKFEVTGNLDEPQFKQVSRKNQNISVGRSSPPKIVDNIPEKNIPPVKEKAMPEQPDNGHFDG